MVNGDGIRAAMVGRRVRDRRNALGLSQGQLATYAGVSRSYVTRLENGEYASPSHHKLSEIARALASSVEELTRPSDEADIAIEDPELDLLFRQLRTADLSANDLAYVKETIRTALRLRRERAQRDGQET